MEDNLKSTQCLILERIKGRDKWVFICFIISILIIIGNEFMTPACILNFIAACIQDFTEAVISFLSKGNKIITELAVSYISGAFVYYLTVIVPEIRKNTSILIEVEKTLKHLIDELHELAGLNDNDNDDVDTLIEMVKQYGKFNDTYYSLYFMRRHLETTYLAIEKVTSNVLSLSPALSQYEIDTLVDIRNRKITQQIKYKYGVDNLINEDELHRYSKNIAKLHNDITLLRESIRNRIYKQ